MNLPKDEDESTVKGLRFRGRRLVRCRGPLLARVPLVPLSCECEGHEERMRAHCERVAREEKRDSDRHRELQCDACGLVARRKGNQARHAEARPVTTDRESQASTGPRWVCLKVKPHNYNVVFCSACYRRWGLGKMPSSRSA
jgi:hypothetical protein